MKWAICASTGSKAHAIVNGKAMCGVPGATIEVTDPEHTDRCGNCDKRWRRLGRAKRPPKKAVARRDVYRPRLTFKDFDQ